MPRDIILLNGFCTGGNTANVLERNVGTMDVSLATIKVIDTSTGAAIPTNELNWTTIDGTQVIEKLESGEAGRFTSPCIGHCTYRVICSGAIGIGLQTISVEC